MLQKSIGLLCVLWLAGGISVLAKIAYYTVNQVQVS